MAKDDKKVYDESLDEDQYLTLEWEDGSSVECEVIDHLELDGKKYIALLPKNEDQAIIFTYKEVDDNIELGNLEDEEFEKVSQAFMDDFSDDHVHDENCKH